MYFSQRCSNLLAGLLLMMLTQSDAVSAGSEAILPGEDAAVPTLPASIRAEVVDAVARVVEREYPWPEAARAIADHLRERQSVGAYEAALTAQMLSTALTADLRAINGDLHLLVRHRSSQTRGGETPQLLERTGVLEGNVGYLKFKTLSGDPSSLQMLTEALHRLSATDAVIIDLRGIPGGSAEMANILISHFTPPNLHSLSVEYPATGQTMYRYTLDSVPGPRRMDVPLYVLVDRGSASAAEDVPFVLQNLGRAVIVGERTAGAGRNNTIVPIAHDFAVSVSNTRVYDPETEREWEGIGVTPDIAALDDALTVAHRHALQNMRSTIDPPAPGLTFIPY